MPRSDDEEAETLTPRGGGGGGGGGDGGGGGGGGRKEVDVFTSLRFLGYLSSLTLTVAVCVGMYARWEASAAPMILVIFILGLFVLGIASILHYYFGMERASLSLFHLWFSFLLGLLCFINSPELDADVKELVTNYLLLASVAVKAVWALAERVCGGGRHRPSLLTAPELLQLLGFAIASTAMPLDKSLAVAGVAVALGATMASLRAKVLLALPAAACFGAVVAGVFFQALGVAANPAALGCYVGRLLCEPLLDVYFSAAGPGERWLPALSLGRFWRLLSLLPLAVAELAFFVLAALKWYLVIPGFCLFGAFWAAYHAVLLITLWGFHAKLSKCQKEWRQATGSGGGGGGGLGLERVMAARGVRHFCLISERLALFCIVFTVVLGAVSWQPSNGLFLSALLVVLPLE
ncbi:hypothetical protein CRUP_019519, partial [Coryphaenoides rupestris]